MKLSTINWLSRAIALPLFIAIVNVSTSAGAEQIARSHRISFGESRKILDSLTILKNLTLTTPVAAPELPAEDIDESSTFTPIWSNPSRQKSLPTSTRKPANKVRATSHKSNG